MKLSGTLEITEWHTPATDYPESEVGNFRIHHIKQSRGYYNHWGLDGYLFLKVKKPIPITNLQEKRNGKWQYWMVDDPPQQRAMEIYAAHAHGRVLVAGLGLGLILHELAKNPRVNSVVVLEKSPEVMELMLSNIQYLFEPKKGEPLFVVTNEDFYEFIENDTGGWDTIIVDLWVSNSADEKMRIFYQEILPLHFMLSQKYPASEITYHGFQTVSAIKPVSEEMVELVSEINS